MSRTDAKSTPLRRHPSRTVPASIIAIVLFAAGIVLAAAGVARLVDGAWPSQVTDAAQRVAGLTWNAATTLTISAVVALLGLIALIAGIKPGGYLFAQLASPNQGQTRTDYVISTSAIAKLAAGRAHVIDGVDNVSASASSTVVQMQVRTTSERTEEIANRVRQAVTETLQQTGLASPPRVQVRVVTKGI